MLVRVVGVVLAVAVIGCGPAVKKGETVAEPHKPTFTGAKIRSFSDTYPITSIVDSPTHIWAGSTHGLVRWELSQERFVLMTASDGLPADRIAAVGLDAQGGVWIATPKGLSRGRNGTWQNFQPAPVGEFLAGIVPTADGQSAWAGGPEGLARLKGRFWERMLQDVGVTTMMMARGGTLWIGTSGHGVLRIARDGTAIESFGPSQGCETDVVRGMTATAQGLLVVGEGPNGPRAALYDGERFFSYSIESPQVLEWAARAGRATLVGAGEMVWEVSQSDLEVPPPPGPVKFTPVAVVTAMPPRSVPFKLALDAASFDKVATQAPAPPPAPRSKNDKDKPVVPRAPRLSTAEAGFRLPEGVTSVASSERGLLVGTRFLGSMRVENGVVRSKRTNDLVAGAERLTVACVGDSDCYLATGGARAWRYDGQSFEIANIDPEAGARVLAILRDPSGGVLAIHRGATSTQLRISSVVSGNWTPITMQAVAVPNGPPDLNFAKFSPDGHLWVGLRYVDKENDAVDYGAAEIALDGGRVIYHRQAGKLDTNTVFGTELPSDMVAMYWRSANEAWFATRSGAARMLDGKVRVFTENDGLESELIYDIDRGQGDEVWVATRRGTGRYDGKMWRFPKMGPFYLRATSLSHDGKDHAFIGTEKGLFCVGDCASPEAIDSRRGLVDDTVLDITVDSRGRVWVLTPKGVSIVEP